MAPTQLVFLVFCTVQVIGVWSTVPDKAEVMGIEEKRPEFERAGFTLEQIAKIFTLYKEKTTYKYEYLVVCSALVSNFTVGEEVPTQQGNFRILERSLSSQIIYSEHAQFFKNVLCSYAVHPAENVKHAEALGLAMLTYFKFEHIRTRNNNNQSVLAARALCDAFWSEDNLANLKLNSNPIALSENQLGEFKNLWKQVENIDWDKSPRLVVENLCNFLNEKISAEEQASALGITANAYLSVLNGTKELSKNNSIEDRANLFRRVCRDIYVSWGSGLFVSQNGTLTEDEIKDFFWYTQIFQPETKWKFIKNVCVHLNETVSIKYIAENVGLSDNQLTQHNSEFADDYIPDYYSSRIDTNSWYNMRRLLLQAVNLCTVIKSDKVRETIGVDIQRNMEIHLGEFVFKASKIFMSPVNERLELLRGVCLTSFLGLYYTFEG